MNNDDRNTKADSVGDDNKTKCSQDNLSSLMIESLKNKKCIACDYYAANFDTLHDHQVSKHTSEELSYSIIKIQDPFFTRKSVSRDEQDQKNFPLLFHNSKVNELNSATLRRPHQFATASTNTQCNNVTISTFNAPSLLQHKSKLSHKDSLFSKCANDLCDDLIEMKNNKLKRKRLNKKKHIHYNMTAATKQLRKPNIYNISNENDAVALNVPSNTTESKFKTLKMWALGNDNNAETNGDTFNINN